MPERVPLFPNGAGAFFGMKGYRFFLHGVFPRVPGPVPAVPFIR